MSPVPALCLAVLICCSLMWIAWSYAIKRDFLSLVDAIWAFGIGLCALLYAFLGVATLERKVSGVALCGVWSIRLGTHLGRRLSAHFPKEDLRYQKLKSNWGSRLKLKSFLFFQMQAISQVLLSLPFLFSAFDSAASFHFSEKIGGCLALFGVLGEAKADRQLARFASLQQNKGRVCQAGLWRYSRHPNYFFEWIIWCGFGLWGFSAPGGWLSLVCPLLMLLLLLFVTGVPPAEASSLKSRGAEYERYQATTSKFFPLPRKKQDLSGDRYVG